MTGTNRSTGGFRRITKKVAPVRTRLFGFVLLALTGIGMLAWITRTTWSQLEQLQKEHAAIKGESFYLGVHLRGEVRSLNDKILHFRLTRDPKTLNAFLEESSELKSWIETNRLHLAQLANLRLLKSMEVSSQVQLLNRAQDRYNDYLTNAAAIIAVDKNEDDKSSFPDTYRQVRAASASLLPICDQLVKSQREGFSEFLAETQDTLAEHQRLLQVTSALIVGLAVALGVQVYRGMIAPLRISLNESKNIIERQEKLASLGILASGVAHEIRNPLTAIKFRLFTLKKTIPAVAQDEDAVIIGNEITRLERIVKDFLLFARPSEPKLARVAAADILKAVHELLRPQLEASAIHLQMRPVNGAYIHADQEQLKQVLINLVQNSAENIGRNGAVNLSMREDTVELGGRERPAVIIAVEDTGKGISPEVEARLFDPFFSTKDGGTGLGLAISSRIVEKHGGILRYETKLNHGTTFEIVMPEVPHDTTEDSSDRRRQQHGLSA